jgi:acetolactate synthase-1/2/3 large subunit
VVELGIRHVFMVTGGGAMHLNHSLGTNKNLECVFNHHEQACAIAAESYYRLENKIALVNVTSGPGGTNAITGVYGAYVDSIGMLVLSGQVKYETTVRATGLQLRQYGDQEIDIEQLVRPVTKYCTMVTDPGSIRYHLEKAFYLATTGRPGPCWLDIPLDVQGAKIDPAKLNGFDPSEIELPWARHDYKSVAKEILDRIGEAERPVILVGTGVRLCRRHDAFLQLVEKLGIPVATAFNAHDAIGEESAYYVGRPGTVGDRAGNFAVQNSDLLLVLGCRLNIRQISYNYASFARAAFKIWVDIDALELEKPSVKADMPVHADLAHLMPEINSLPYRGPSSQHVEWLAWCRARHAKYLVLQKSYWKNEKINPYCFMDELFRQMPDGQIAVTGNATACVTAFQSAVIKPGQRLWSNSGCASMGYDLPAAIGACKAANNQPVVCLAGDGSIMMNLQELQTISTSRMPIKIFVINNQGYLSIFQTHRNFFNGLEVGSGPKSGVGFPDFKKIADAFDIAYFHCNTHDEMRDAIANTFSISGPVICEVIADENQPFAPKLSAKQHPDGRITSPPLEDLSPFLDREEFKSNMIIDVIDD